MAQAIFLSIVAGIASALLSGLLTPGSVLGALLMFVAPLPLMIVGLGWHSLVAALGALVGCLLMSIGLSSKAALIYGALVGLPAWLAAVLLPMIVRHGMALPKAQAGRWMGAAILGSIGFYAVVIPIIGALTIDADHARFVQRLSKTVEDLFRTMFEGGMAQLPNGSKLSDFAQLYALMLPPMLTFLICTMLTLSLWLAVRIVQRSERLPFPSVPAYTLSLPKAAPLVFVGGMFLASVVGYVGLVGMLIMVASSFALMMAGLSWMHFRTLGRGDRPIILGTAWALLLFMGLPGFVYAFLGALDASLDFRRPKDGSQPPNL
ncbi:MAG: hypothetical protein LCH61_20175 [Proteobacteria bacterium]|nr:hypothetical protein [Pseudomonadota bacterium]